ncbi:MULTISPECIES: hypothetical protein [unclassified Phenylobacterium]|uniref:hypothetical protein n=1 Tax=unclassified Phenylobacterium TaxID=2640670 RepID=UPI000A850831|nr:MULTISPECIES: hypothetical protein [unclassified Phenylobacterium]
MRQPRDPAIIPRNAVHLKIGRWFEASASGWGVVIVPLALGLLLAAAVLIGPAAP